MAELSSTLFARIQAYLSNLSASAHEIRDHFFIHIIRQATDPDSTAVIWTFRLWDASIFASSVCLQWLILRIVHSNRHSLQQGSSQFSRLINCFGVEELNVTKVAVFQIVHLQANHLNLSTQLEQVNDILLRRIDGDVSQPQRVPIRGFLAFRLTAQNSTRSLGVVCWVRSHLVHVSKIDLDPAPHEIVSLLSHGDIYTLRIFKLDMGKVAPNMVLTDSDLRDCATVLEKVNVCLFLWSSVSPAYPNCFASIRLRVPSASFTISFITATFSSSVIIIIATTASTATPRSPPAPPRSRTSALATRRALARLSTPTTSRRRTPTSSPSRRRFWFALPFFRWRSRS